MRTIKEEFEDFAQTVLLSGEEWPSEYEFIWNQHCFYAGFGVAILNLLGAETPTLADLRAAKLEAQRYMLEILERKRKEEILQ